MRDVLLVGNSLAGTVSVVDGRSFDVLGTVNVIPDIAERLAEIEADLVRSVAYGIIKHQQLVTHFEPGDGNRFVDDLFVSPDGTTLYASRSNIGDVAAFDLTKPEHPLVWRTRVDGFKADHATLSPDGKHLVVSATTVDRAQIFDAKTGKVVSSFETGKFPHQNDYSADGKRIYNASIGNVGLPKALDAFKGDRRLTVVDAKTFQIIRTYDFESGIRPAAFTPDEKTMYVQLSYFNGIAKFDLESGKIVTMLEEPLSDFAKATYNSYDEYPHDSAHHGLALSGDGKRLCDAGTIDNTVAIVLTDSMTVEKTIDVGKVPYWATTSADGRSCFVSLSGEDKISVIDYASGKETKLVPVGKFPQRSRLGRLPASVVAKLSTS